MRRFSALLLIAASLVLPGSAAANYGYTNLVVFGDSLSDSGNLYNLAAVPGAPYFNGRFSNGPNFIDVLADNLHLSSLPATAGGLNYAVGGARTTSNAFFDAPSQSAYSASQSLQGQVGNYLSAHAADNKSSTLYSVFIGANDVVQAMNQAAPYLAANDYSTAIQTANNVVGSAVSSATTQIKSLLSAGAQTILIPNLPDLGLTPRASAGGAGAQYFAQQLSLSFNQGLHDSLQSLVLAAPSVRFIEFDVYGLFNNIVSNPAAYGFSNVTQPCLQTSGICADPAATFFWDDLHPTAAAHKILGDKVFAAVVPEPESWAMLLAGLGLLIGFRRRSEGC